MYIPSERDRLLPDASIRDVAEAGTPVTQAPKEKLGPLEISNSNKCAILAGIWLADFLVVCIFQLSET